MLRDLFSNRLFIGALAFFILCVAGSLLYMQHVQQIDAEKLAETEKKLKQWQEQHRHEGTPINTRQDTRIGDPVEIQGDTSQGGHFHADGSWHTEPHETPSPITNPTQPMQLTYHAELLEKHPVEALRLLAEETNHWSAEYIPPFPPDDKEAAELARAVYIVRYYHITSPQELPDTLEFKRASQVMENFRKRSTEQAYRRNNQLRNGIRPDSEELARMNDLGKLEQVGSPMSGPLSDQHLWPSMFNDIRY